MTSIRVFAPAKINLTLHVGPLRADGRHALQSIVTFADVGDTVSVRAGDGFFVTGPFASALSDAQADNLAWRGYRAVGKGGALTLEKNLPIASGIGGGSADAAAAMRAANAFLGLGLTAEELERRAFPLGADIPVCVRSAPAFMEGAGEVLTPLALPDLFGVLVNPGVSLPTAEVFKRFDVMGLGEEFRSAPAPVWDSAAAAMAGLAEMRNDLEAPARALAPEVGDVLDALARGGVLARMSGSGATCFALTQDADAASELAARLGVDRPHWWVRAARFGAVDVTPGKRPSAS